MKAYIVKIKAIKNKIRGLIRLTRYLVDRATKSHKNTDIKLLVNTPNAYISYAKLNADRAELRTILARKGGKPISHYGRSLTFNFPKTMSPTKEQSHKITTLILRDILKYINHAPKAPLRRRNQSEETYLKNIKAHERAKEKHQVIEEEEFLKSVLAVFHDQENPHIHLNLSSYINTQNIRAYKLKSFLKFAKTSFTFHTDNIMGTNIQEYKVEKQGSYTKEEIIMTAKSVNKAVEKLKQVVCELRENYEHEDKFFNKIFSDLDKGHTEKAAKKIEKLKNKYRKPSL